MPVGESEAAAVSVLQSICRTHLAIHEFVDPLEVAHQTHVLDGHDHHEHHEPHQPPHQEQPEQQQQEEEVAKDELQEAEAAEQLELDVPWGSPVSHAAARSEGSGLLGQSVAEHTALPNDVAGSEPATAVATLLFSPTWSVDVAARALILERATFCCPVCTIAGRPGLLFELSDAVNGGSAPASALSRRSLSALL